MFCSLQFLFILSFVLLNSVCSNKICDYKDVKCFTKGANKTFKLMVLGVKGVVESSDPLHLPDSEEEIKIEKVLKYKLKNGTLSGMSSCRFIYHKLNEDSTYKSEILCEQLVLSHHYEAQGYIGPIEIDGQGYLDLKLNNYVIKFRGEFEQFISEIDQKRHFHIISNHEEFEPRGEVEVDIKSELHSDKAKSDLAKNYLKENPNLLEQGAHSPFLENYMKIFIRNLNTYLGAIPADTALPSLS